MKIPTQQINVKRTALVVAGMAVVTGLAVPTATFAQGGDHSSERNGSWSQDNRKHGNHGGWHSPSSSSWERISAEDFTAWHAANLAKVDKYIEKNNLTVENGAALRSTVETNATELANNLTALEQLRTSIGDNKDISEEQRAALKDQTVLTFSAYYDYKLSFQDYKSAIKAAADQNGVKADGSLEDSTQ